MPVLFHVSVKLIEINGLFCILYNQNRSQVTRYLFWKQCTHIPKTERFQCIDRTIWIHCYRHQYLCLYRWFSVSETFSNWIQGKKSFISYKSNCNNFQEHDLLWWHRYIDSSITLINDPTQWTNGMFYGLEWPPGTDYYKAMLRRLQVWNSICGHKCQSRPLFTLEW